MASDNRNGTVIVTGANGALGRASVTAFLENYPSHYLVLTVRNLSPSNPNTTKLHRIVESSKSTNVSIEALDLSSLSNVRTFAEDISKRVATGEIPPITAIVCNAYSWSLLETRYTSDNYEDTFQIVYLSHFVLVLKLLDSMDKKSGRIVLVGSEAHDSAKKNWVNPLEAEIPSNIEELVTPPADPKGEEFIRGFNRYSNAKLAVVMFLHLLNRKFQEDTTLKYITVTAIDPGLMTDSNNWRNTPRSLRVMLYISTIIARAIDTFTDAIRTSKLSGKDLAVLSVAPEKAGVRGYFEGLVAAKSSEGSLDEAQQAALWKASVRWTKLEQGETVLKLD